MASVDFDAKKGGISSISEPILESSEDVDGNKSSLRLKYEAEVRVIEAKLGPLDQIRKDLGLSKRKLAQLLMVDPSALTRWSHRPETIPPIVFRALQWYYALIEKKPEWHPQNSFLRAEMDVQREELTIVREKITKKLSELSGLEQKLRDDADDSSHEFKNQLSLLRKEVELRGGAGLFWKFLLLFNTFALIYVLFFSS